MKKGLLIGAILWAVMAVLLWQQRQGDALVEEISRLAVQTRQIEAEVARTRMAIDRAAAKAGERERLQVALEQFRPASPSTNPAPATAASDSSTSFPSPVDHYWSEESPAFWMRKDYLPRLDVQPLRLHEDGQWRITDPAAAALVLAKEERIALDRAFAEATGLFRQVAGAYLTQELDPQPADDRVDIWTAKFAVAAFAAEAALFRQQFTNTVYAVLDAERAGHFLRFLNKRLETEYAAFGDRDREIAFKYSRTGEGGWSLAVTESTRERVARSRSCGNVTSRSLNPTNVPTYWRHLIDVSTIE